MVDFPVREALQQYCPFMISGMFKVLLIFFCVIGVGGTDPSSVEAGLDQDTLKALSSGPISESTL